MAVSMRRPVLLAAVVLVSSAAACGGPRSTATPPAVPAPMSWIARSDADAQVLLGYDAEFSPERASRLGLEMADERTVDLSNGFRARRITALRGARGELESHRATETDPLVLQDIAILERWVDLELREIELEERTMVPFWDVARMVFQGITALLDDQAAPARRTRAVERLRRYTGLAPGSWPLTEQARGDVLGHLSRPELAPPTRLEVEKALATSATVRDGVAKLFEKYGLHGWEEPFAALEKQLAAYDEFLRSTVLPHARPEFALPREVYALRLERVGVDIPADRLVAMAHEQFAVIQGEMQRVAAAVAKQRNLPSADYRDVIRELKKEQLVGDAILPHYKQRLAEVEDIIRRERLVTLPARPARIRLATAAESAQQPAPHMDPPRLLGNKGEQGEFVLPLSMPAPTGSKQAEEKYDDFTYAAASWTLVAHEARPGHELQFDSMVERGVSIARARYAFNSVNVEGWGLYSEAITLPFMPPEGQLVSLQLRLQRAARAFLDPELQQGKWTFDSARDFLEKEVGLSHAFATSEVERYTFRMPAQATAYFYGFTRLEALRREAEQRAAGRFDAMAFHDAILGEGLLPPDLLRAAVLKKLGGT
jgi:hypothetical protein